MDLNENQQDNEVAFASHLGTNYTPTEDELLEIHNLLVEPSVRISELEVEMARKAAEYDAIVAKHARLKQLVANYRALASPMRRLPIDLLREVFYHCLPTAHNTIFSWQDPPAVLTRVCSTWRTVALTTPVLWASFHIPVPRPMSDDMFFKSELDREGYRTSLMNALSKRTWAMKEWLARSGACELSVSLHDVQQPNHSTVNPNYADFLNAIISHSKRWRSMTFIASADDLTSIAALTTDDVPALEELVIKMWGGLFRSPFLDYPGPSLLPILSWAKSSFLSAPRLRRVSFVNLYENINTLPLRWQQLTHLSLTGGPPGPETKVHYSSANIAALLAKCPGLVSARLEISFDESWRAPESWHTVAEPSPPICWRPILLPHLTTLVLHNRMADIYLSMLETPRLTTLSYYALRAGPASELIALVRRSSDTLVELSTDATAFFRADFFALLKAARKLKRLSHRLGSTMQWLDPWDISAHIAFHFDDVFLGMLVGKRLASLADVDTEANAESQEEGFHETDGDTEDYAESQEERYHRTEAVADGYSCVLLPELESFDSCRRVSFTGQGLLECLMLRQGLAHGPDDSVASSEIADSAPYCKFKHFSVPFSRDDILPSVSEQLAVLREDGLVLHLSYPPVKVFDGFSPAEGIADEMAFRFYQDTSTM